MGQCDNLSVVVEQQLLAELRERRYRRRACWLGGLTVVCLGVLLWGARTRPLPAPPVALLEGPPGNGAAPVGLDMLPVVEMPSTPKAGQKRPPCDDPNTKQEALNGGCWLRMAQRPPCGALYKHGDACYLPVAEVKGEPVTGAP